MKKISTLVVIMLSVIAINLDAAITVRVKIADAGWQRVSLWAWTSEGNVFASWPGQELTQADGWYSYTFAENITTVNYMFANTDNAEIKSSEIEGVTEDRCWSITQPTGGVAVELNCTTGEALSDQGQQDDGKVIVKVKKPTAWADIYAYQWKDGATTLLGGWPGTKMQDLGDGWYGLYVYTGANLIINNNSVQTNDYLITAAVCLDGVGDKVDMTIADCTGVKDPTDEQPIVTPVDDIIVKVQKPATWGDLNIWAWGSTDATFMAQFTAWPGVAMTKLTGDWYSFTVKADATFMFNDGNSKTQATQSASDICFTVSSEYELDGDNVPEYKLINADCNSQTALVEATAANITVAPTFVIDNIVISAPTNIIAVSVYNVAGQQVAQKAVNSTNTSLNLSNLASGMYILSIQTADTQSVQNIIKK